MSDKVGILFPVGRCVQGSFYEPNTKDFDGNPLVYKTGDNAGQPRVEYFFAVAIPKGPGETHWAQSEWGAKVWAFGHERWPGNPSPAQRRDFAWKIDDGDSTDLNKKNKRPCDYEGFPGHWIVKASGSFQPKLVDAKGQRELRDDERIKCGDFVQLFAEIESNRNANNPGIYLNHRIVAHSGYGKEIVGGGIDPTTVGFGGALPPGASAVPLGAMPAATAASHAAPPPSASAAPPPPVPATAPVSTPPPSASAAPPPPVPATAPVSTPPPNTAFTAGATGVPPIPGAAMAAPPPPAAPAGPAYVMTGTLGAFTREQAHAGGWNDEQLIAAGHMRQQ